MKQHNSDQLMSQTDCVIVIVGGPGHRLITYKEVLICARSASCLRWIGWLRQRPSLVEIFGSVQVTFPDIT